MISWPEVVIEQLSRATMQRRLILLLLALTGMVLAACEPPRPPHENIVTPDGTEYHVY